jgi:hypothetical protein
LRENGASSVRFIGCDQPQLTTALRRLMLADALSRADAKIRTAKYFLFSTQRMFLSLVGKEYVHVCRDRASMRSRIFGLFACPVPLFGQVCIVAALIWRARSGWFRP